MTDPTATDQVLDLTDAPRDDLAQAIAEVQALADELRPAVFDLAVRARYVIADARLQMDKDAGWLVSSTNRAREVFEEQGIADLHRAIAGLRILLEEGTAGSIIVAGSRGLVDLAWVETAERFEFLARKEAGLVPPELERRLAEQAAEAGG